MKGLSWGKKKEERHVRGAPRKLPATLLRRTPAQTLLRLRAISPQQCALSAHLRTRLSPCNAPPTHRMRGINPLANCSTDRAAIASKSPAVLAKSAKMDWTRSRAEGEGKTSAAKDSRSDRSFPT